MRLHFVAAGMMALAPVIAAARDRGIDSGSSVLITYGEQASMAVACGLRPPDWGRSVHDKLVALLAPAETAGSRRPRARRDSALRLLARREDEAARANTRATCAVIGDFALPMLEELLSGEVERE